MNRLRYFAIRTGQTVILLLLILTFLFFLFRLLPGSYTDLMVFQGASPEVVAEIREKWGLNEPLSVQYKHFIWNYLTLDAGTSLQFRKPVWEIVRMKIFNTFILVGPAITAAYLLGSLIGTFFGVNRDSLIDKYGSVPLISVGMVPEFFTSILLIIIFANWFNIFPTGGMIPPEVATRFADAPWWRPYLTSEFLYHYILPFLAVFLRYFYLPVLIMRTNVVEVMGQDFIEYHRISGLPSKNRFQHVLKHSILPVITLYPVSMTRAISGLVLIETVFNWPGIGYALVEAVLSRDYPVVQFVFFIAAVFVILSNYLVDILYSVIDPRVSVDE